LHSCGVNTKPHGLFLLIYIGFFHIGWVGITNHPWPSFLNARECGKLKNVSRVACGRPTLLTIAKGGRSSWQTVDEWCPRSNMSSTKHVGDLGMSSYVRCITSSGVRLVHIHQNWWAREPTEATSTYINSLIQALIVAIQPKQLA
jgi:hypothetical protein